MLTPSARIHHVSLPHGLPARLMTMPRRVCRAYLFFWQRKALYVGGTIKNFSKRVPELAARFNISERTVWNYTKELRSRDMVYYQEDQLRLIASRRVGEAEMTSVSRFHPIPVTELPQLEAYVAMLAVKEKLGQQEYVKREKALEEVIEQNPDLGISNPSVLSKATRARYRKMLAREIAAFEKTEPARYFRDQSRHDALANDKLNPRVTLSRAGLAATLGLRSKSSGTRKARELVAAGYLKDDVCEVTVQWHATRAQWTALRRANFAGNYNLRYRSGRIVRVLANQLTVLLPERA